MSQVTELQKKLTALYNKIVGDELTHISVILNQGWIVYVKSKPAANTIADMGRQIPDMNRVEIEEDREEIDILDEEGELIDIKLGNVIGYRVNIFTK